MNDIIYQVGITTDNKIVVNGIWKMFETHGVPLDIIFAICMQRQLVPDWVSLYRQMLDSGMKHSRILSKLEEAISDSFGKEFCEVVISKLEQIFNSQRDKQ